MVAVGFNPRTTVPTRSLRRVATIENQPSLRDEIAIISPQTVG